MHGARDARVSVPIFNDRLGGKTRLWATLGVRLVMLEASYARPPKMRSPEDGGSSQIEINLAHPFPWRHNKVGDIIQ